uniref:Ribosomal protein S2 n=1 Tax=Aureoumbra lagunensis TaxID=44058 RepID=A0A7U0KSU9_9STRA|nr:ribosomal protein S2 [Aureoumbra lagunensis]QQW50400.1 ribosomal protein S2 [Aureoumbra lagunensis]
MKTSVLERKIVKNFLSLENCFFNKDKNKFFKKNKKYFLGFKKGLNMVDLEKSILIFFKALRLLKIFQISGLKVSFLGCPLICKESVFLISSKCKNFQVYFEKSFQDFLYEKKSSKKTHLLVIYNQPFFYKDSLKKLFVTIVLGNAFNANLVDFPILLNPFSVSSLGLFFYLIKASSK